LFQMSSLDNYLLVVLLVVAWSQSTHQHGRLIEPPARNSMWRIGYNTTPNYEDSELFCGGIVNQWSTNKGKCGLCGDSYSLKQPRPYESGGKYVRNISTRIYHPGSVIDVVIQLVANHLGTFEFSLCPRNSFEERETEECFIPLKTNGTLKYRLNTHRKGTFNLPVELPKDVTCERCILRWHWKSANNWGTCENGRQGVGCGPQETYRNCADIIVRHEMGIRGPFINHIDERSNKIEEDYEDRAWVATDDHTTFHKLS
ncbi:hypothetical protein BLOT_006234, partial [Blomia tropicalis]